MPPPPEDEDHAAMARLRDGDDRALDEIMLRWQRRLTAYLLRLTGNEATSLDLSEETFVRVYQNRSKYRPTGRFSTWLFAIATNLARQHFRWKSRHPTVSLDEPIGTDGERSAGDHIAADGPDPGVAAESRERTTAVRDAVLALPDDLRNAIVLFEYEDLSHREIAGIVGCSPKAVETRIHRARAFLRERLTRWMK